MPVTPTYPGVYIQEIPSGVRTITGVATAITAFIGRALRGPVNAPVTINHFGDFERTFGGLWSESPMSYAVRDFYLNGGGQAIIVRLFHPYFVTDADRVKARTAAEAVVTAAKAGAPATAADVAAAARAAAALETPEPGKTAADTVATAAEKAAEEEQATPQTVQNAAQAAVDLAAPRTRARLTMGGLTLEAAYEGVWGNALRGRIDHSVVGPDASNLFNLSVYDGSTGRMETLRNLSVLPGHARQVDMVLAQESQLIRVVLPLPNSRPAASPAPEEGKGLFDPAGRGSSGVSEPASDGVPLQTSDYTGNEADKCGIYALENADLFNLLCIPPYAPGTDVGCWDQAAAYCTRRRAMLLVDPPSGWTNTSTAKAGVANLPANSANAAVFFPRLRQPDPLRSNVFADFAPCGAVAGVIARTDTQRGIWKAPAGLDATLVGVPQLSVGLTDAENGELNPLGINCLRALPAAGRVVWGARTRLGDDRLASEWKYIPVRRLALYIEESLYRGTQWVVFEPNDEPLWAQIRLNVGAFMQNLFRQGAFQGKTPREAYFVKCDRESTTQHDMNQGIVNIIVGFAPLKPAEFVIISLQQMAGQMQA